MKTRLRPALALLVSAPFLVGAGFETSQPAGTASPTRSNSLQSLFDQPAPRAFLLPWLRDRRRESTPVSVYLSLEGRCAIQALRDAGPLAKKEQVALVNRQLALLAGKQKRVTDLVESLGGVVEANLVRTTNAVQVRVPWHLLDRGGTNTFGSNVWSSFPTYERALTTAVPFVGADRLWNASGVAATGKGVRVGIVDTGIDYLHADFGGLGDPQAYQDNDRTVIEPGTFPTAKVIGGWDFVGDDYNGENTVHPDPDPLDCAREQENYISGGHEYPCGRDHGRHGCQFGRHSVRRALRSEPESFLLRNLSGNGARSLALRAQGFRMRRRNDDGVASAGLVGRSE